MVSPQSNFVSKTNNNKDIPNYTHYRAGENVFNQDIIFEGV